MPGLLAEPERAQCDSCTGTKKGAVTLKATAPYNPGRRTHPVEGAGRRSPAGRPFRLAAGRLTPRPAIGGCQYLIGHPCYHVISNTVKIVIVNKKIISGRFLG